jgi:hypothetical protein
VEVPVTITASAFTLRQLTGPERDAELRLTGRALPIGVLPLSARMRAEVAYYAGNPNGTVQFLGAEEGETEVSGVWRQRYIGYTDYAWYNGSPITDVVELATIVDDIRARGALVALTWSHVQRVGYIREFSQQWLAADEVEWTIAFTFTGRVDPALLSVPILAQRGGVEDIASSTADDVAALQDVADNPPTLTTDSSPQSPLSAAQGALASMDDAVASLTLYASALSDTAQRAAEIAVTPVAAAQRAMACLSSLEGTALSISETLPLQLQSAAQSASYSRTGQRLAAVLWADDFGRGCRRSRRNAAQRRSELQGRVAGNLIAAHVVRLGDDLRRIAMRYYGTQDRWHALAAYNGLPSSVVVVGAIIYVPQARDGAA